MGDNNPLTKLVLDLRGVHPDDSFSSIPYEKGHMFLRYIESIVGGPGMIYKVSTFYHESKLSIIFRKIRTVPEKIHRRQQISLH